MKSEVSIREELEKVKAEISRLEHCKKVLEDTLAFELLKLSAGVSSGACAGEYLR